MATACPHLTYTTEAEPYVKENYQFKSNFCLFVTKALSCDQVMSQIIFLKFSHIWNGHVKRAGSAEVRLVGRQRLVVEHIQAALLWNNTSCLVDFLSSAILFPVTPMNSLCCDKLWSCFCCWARLLHGIFCRKNEIKKKQSKTFGIRYLQKRQLCILFHSGQQYFFGLTYFARHQKEVPKTWPALDHLKLIV